MKPRTLISLILVGYTLLAGAYAALTPIFEAPDESYHFAMVQRLAQDFRLPVQDASQITPWFQEGSQPPLYYYLASLIVRLSGGAQPILELPPNPHAAIGIGLAQHNQNAYLHRGAGTQIPTPLSRAFYLTRALSIVLGLITLIGIIGTARESFPQTPSIGLLMVAFVAFNPQFVFMTASVNNDNLVTALSTLGLWLILRWMRTPTRREGLILALVMALAALSKLSGLILYPTAFVALVILLWKRRIPLTAGIRLGVIWIGAWALIAGWWFVRNRLLYGDWTGTNLMIAIIQPRLHPYTLSVMLNEMEGLRISFWGLFGWFNVIAPQWLYPLMDALTMLSLIGGVGGLIRLWREKKFERLQPIGILALHLVITFGALINWTRQTPGTQGRLLFPAMGAVAALIVSGWWALIPRGARWTGWRPLIGAVSVLPLFWVTLTTPLGVIAPAYAPPPTVADLPLEAVRTQVHFGSIEVMGYLIDSAPIRLGESLSVTVFLRSTGDGTQNSPDLSLFLTVLDPVGKAAGTLDTYPGGGDLPTSAFEPGLIYADHYLIPITAPVSTPMQGRIEVGFWQGSPEKRIVPVDVEGRPLTTLIVHGGTIVNPAPPAPSNPQSALFSGALRMNGYSLHREDSRLELKVQWEALTSVYEDFNVLVHLIPEGDEKPARQGDSAPLGGIYPTSAWAVGVPFEDTYRLDLRGLPSGTYRLRLGLYRLHDFSRLPVEGGGDTVQLDQPLILD